VSSDDNDSGEWWIDDKEAGFERERDELIAALEAALRWVDQLGGKALMNEPGDARDVLARIKGGG